MAAAEDERRPASVRRDDRLDVTAQRASGVTAVEPLSPAKASRRFDHGLGIKLKRRRDASRAVRVRLGDNQKGGDASEHSRHNRRVQARGKPSTPTGSAGAESRAHALRAPGPRRWSACRWRPPVRSRRTLPRRPASIASPSSHKARRVSHPVSPTIAISTTRHPAVARMASPIGRY